MRRRYYGGHLSFKDQIEQFKKRKMSFKNEDEALKKLNFIYYYKIKEFSLPYMNNENEYKEGVFFEDIIERFYCDKNLRLYFLRITEKIEIALKTQVAYILGRDYGAFGYLDFKKWCNQKEYCNSYIFQKEKEFRRKLKILEYENKNKIMIKEYSENYSGDLPIWFAVELLTLGEIIDIFLLMSSKYKKEIAMNYGLTNDIFETCIKNIRLTRNLSAHNSNIIDIEFQTKPKMSLDMKNKLHFYNLKNNSTSNKIALTIVIMEYLVYKINDKFPGGAIKKNLKKLCPNKTDIEAQKLGFKDYKTIEKLKI